MTFSFDTSAFVGTWRRYYPPPNFPSLWERIDGLVMSGGVFASRTVRDELEKQDDEVFSWAKAQKTLFREDEPGIQAAVSNVYRTWPSRYRVDWGRRLLGADLFVIAHAQLSGGIVVTDEKVTRNYEAPRIPDACAILDIKCLTPLGFIQECGWTF